MKDSMIKVNGINLHVVQAGNPDGEPLLLLHGFPENWTSWRHQVEPLTNAGFQLWMPDLRGYNLSDKPSDVSAYSLDVLADDIVGLVDAMGVRRGKVVGHDWGGGALWWALNRTPERFEKAVLLNIPHHNVFSRYVRQNEEQRSRVRYMGFLQMPVLPELLFMLASDLVIRWAFGGNPNFTNEDFRQYKQAWAQPGAVGGMLNWYRAVRQAPPQKLDSPRIETPVLLIWGAKDKAFLRDLAQPSAALCDEGRVHFIEEATHWVQHDAADEVSRLIIEFMR
jgi:epoxide hydrolase 4